MSRSAVRMFLIVAAAALAIRLGHFAAIRGHPFYSMSETWTDSDMHQFQVWARHLASGDWLDLDTFRPYFDYQAAIAPPAIWNQWYGHGIYYQPPLYPYLLAAVWKITGSFDVFRLGQLLLGALNCGLLSILALRLYGPRAGWIAGLAAAAFAPFILYDGEILRGTVVLTAQIALLLALSSSGWWRPALSGAAFGIAYLAEPSILLFAPPAVAWMIWTDPRGGAAAVRAVGLFAAGAAVALAPLMARNLYAGAPALSSTTRGPIAFVMGNAPDAQPGGAHVPPSTGPILKASGYGMMATIRETLRLYDGHYLPLLGKQWEKLASLWSAYEVPDNPSFYYGARVSPPVRFGLPFLPVAAAGLTGLALAVAGARRDRLLLLVPLYVVAAHAVFLLAHVNSRYRQPLAMALILTGSHAAAWAWDRGGRAAAAVAAAAVALALVLPKAPPPGYGYFRPAEFVIAARLFVARGQVDRAEGEMRDAIASARIEEAYRPMIPVLLYELGTMQAEAGRRREAADSLRAALAEDPGFVEAKEALANLGSDPGEGSVPR